jgi:probable HAF family extracellular repeat protein
MKRLAVVALLLVAACQGTGPDIVSLPPPPSEPPPPPPPPPPAPPSPFEEFGNASLWVFPASLNDRGEAVGVSASHSHQLNVAQTPVLFRNHRMSFVDTTKEAHRAVIDNQGTIAAAIYLPYSREHNIWDSAGEHVTPLPEYWNAIALAMNSRGEVLVVDSLRDAAKQSLVVRGGTVEQLGSLHQQYRSTRARAMNNQGKVVGSSAALVRTKTDVPFHDGTLVYHPFLWQNGVMRDLGVFGRTNEPCTAETPCARGEAMDINSQGDVVGYSEDSAMIRRPFIWRNGVLTDLGVFPGRPAMARLINDRGMVAGDNDTLAFVWENGTLTTFSLGGFTRVTAMNQRGDVAGTSFASDGRQHAFVWKDGRLIDLGIPLAGGCAAIPVDINEVGEVLIDVAMECHPEEINPFSPFVRYTGNVYHKQRAVIWHPPAP